VPKGVEAVINCALCRCDVLARAKSGKRWLCERLYGWHRWIDPLNLDECGVELLPAAASAYRSLAWAADEGGCLLRRAQHAGG
jgi:hypothetical protein